VYIYACIFYVRWYAERGIATASQVVASVRPSVRDVEVSLSDMLEFFENILTVSQPAPCRGVRSLQIPISRIYSEFRCFRRVIAPLTGVINYVFAVIKFLSAQLTSVISQ